ncbi:MAG TPA: cytochrome b/b6 domain-containing protein [Desulfomonilaceae bacterium]|nr:cytochrome b/b6 domain-containing protein [Desulfomonilaceae bacterium]
MERKTSFLSHWKWTTLLGVVATALALAFQCAVMPCIAQQQSQPAESQVKQPESGSAQKSEQSEAEKPAAEKQEEAAPQKAEKGKTEELPNSSCMDCHNPDILKLSKDDLAEQVTVDEKPVPPRAKPRYVVGELNLSLKEKEFAAGVHAETSCVTCHKDVTEVPHKQRLKTVDCKECHEDYVENVKASAHGDKAAKAVGCTGCHDVHYGQSKATYEKDFKRTNCVHCHKAYGMDTEKGHAKLYEARLHLALDCMLCHKGKEAGVHNIPAVKTMVAGCEACHSKKTILSTAKVEPTSCVAYLRQTTFTNSDVLKKFGYVLGANRIPALDSIIVLAVIAPLGLPIVHGGLRILTRRKEPLHLPEEKILLHPFVERIWHWFQALCIVMLIITGVMLHWPEKFPGWFNWSVTVHNWFGMGAVVAFVVWFLYNIGTGRISHYIPKKGEIPAKMIKQAKFYGYGIFKHEPHPYAPSEDNKFNPLQKIAYLQFQALLLPILLISGILYMYPDTFKGVIGAIGGMTVLGIVHLILGGLFAAFLVAHIYLATTGETIGENFKAIVFGYGIKSDHHDEHV